MNFLARGAIKALRFYQKTLSPDQGLLRYVFSGRGTCVMYPSCSEYMIGSISRHGLLRGFFRGLLRIFRCHPFQKKLIDHP